MIHVQYVLWLEVKVDYIQWWQSRMLEQWEALPSLLVALLLPSVGGVVAQVLPLFLHLESPRQTLMLNGEDDSHLKSHSRHYGIVAMNNTKFGIYGANRIIARYFCAKSCSVIAL